MASAAVHSVVGSIFVVAPYVCGSIVYGSCLELQYLVSLLVLQSEEKAFCCSVGVCVPCLFHAVPWTVIVAFPGHTRLFFHPCIQTIPLHLPLNQIHPAGLIIPT